MPLFVIALTTPPAAAPNSAEKLLVWTVNSLRASNIQIMYESEHKKATPIYADDAISILPGGPALQLYNKFDFENSIDRHEYESLKVTRDINDNST